MGTILVKVWLYLETFSETKMRKTDRLSRWPDWKVGVEKNNNSQIFIKDHWLCSLSKKVIEEPEVDIVEKIKKLGVKMKK